MFIVLDLDEVLVDFTGGAAKVFGKTVPEMAEEFGEWWSGDRLWDGIREHGEQRFWEELELLPWAYPLLKWVESITDDWMIVTSPSRSNDSYAGKRNFLRREFGLRFDRYIITPHKFLFAKEGRLLIDDLDKNCLSFEANGGESILFPSRFNQARNHYDEPIEYVQSMYELCVG